MLKELLRALYAIIDAIKNKNNSDGEGGGEQSDYKIKLFNTDSEPVGLIAYKSETGYIGKYYSIEEIFASTIREVAEIVDIDIEEEEEFEIVFQFLYRNYDDVKQGVITGLHIENIEGYKTISEDSSWNMDPIIRDVELDGETYYFFDPNGGNSPIIEDNR